LGKDIFWRRSGLITLWRTKEDHGKKYGAMGLAEAVKGVFKERFGEFRIEDFARSAGVSSAGLMMAHG